jgi:Uma2 family endonuclease
MTATESLMAETWERICTTPGFSHPGFTCDVLPDGRIIMSPTFNYHGWFQARLSVLLAQLAPSGQPFVELAVLTAEGLFEVDVAWTEAFAGIRKQKYASPAPEICIEVESEGNTEAEFARKRAALFDVGCKEVWIVSKEGMVSFFVPKGPTLSSKIIPVFPKEIEG